LCTEFPLTLALTSILPEGEEVRMCKTNFPFHPNVFTLALWEREG
jgi:hypothetical protein